MRHSESDSVFVFVCWDQQQRVVTFSQASGTFIAVAIINSVPTETSFGWAGQYLSLRVWAVAHTLLLSSSSSLALSAPLLPCHLMYLRSVMLPQFKESCVLSELMSNWDMVSVICFFTLSVKNYSDCYSWWFWLLFLNKLWIHNQVVFHSHWDETEKSSRTSHLRGWNERMMFSLEKFLRWIDDYRHCYQ